MPETPPKPSENAAFEGWETNDYLAAVLVQLKVVEVAVRGGNPEDLPPAVMSDYAAIMEGMEALPND